MKPLLLTEEPARRGFLRSLVMATGASAATHRLILPAQTIITPENAHARLKEHLKGAEAAMRELYPMARVSTWGNVVDGGHERYRELFASGDRGAITIIGVQAALPLEDAGRLP